MNSKDLIESIDRANEGRGISDRQFAIEAGIDPSQWSKMRTGGRNITVTFLKTLARIRPECAKAIKNYIGLPIGKGSN